MHSVYLIESLSCPGQRHTGVTGDLRARLNEHNAGKSPHTSKFGPWPVRTYLAFSQAEQAKAFEAYLKSGSGHAFANRRLWPD